MTRRVKVKAIQRADLDHETIAMALWVQTKAILRERRAQEARAKRRREARREQ